MGRPYRERFKPKPGAYGKKPKLPQRFYNAIPDEPSGDTRCVGEPTRRGYIPYDLNVDKYYVQTGSTHSHHNIGVVRPSIG